MMMKHVLREELIGIRMEIINARNISLIGTKGKIIDETKNTIIVKTKNKEKILLKNEITFIIEKNNQRLKIDGKKIIGKPEKRIK